LARIARPDVSLAFFGLPSGAVAWFLQLMLGIPYVVSLRGGDVPGFRPYDFWLYHRIAVPFLHVIWRGAKVVVANSEGLRSLARAFDSRVDIRVVPNGVDTERFAAAERKWDPAIVLSVGRIVHQKGLDVALQALAGLRDLDWHWRIAGDGPELPTLRARIAQAGLASRASFLGWQTSEQLRQEYARANLFLFPSRHEGMPNAMLEAMASGLPVIATRIAGNEELVENEQTGLLVQSEDPDALMSALRRVLPDGVLRAKMGRAGRARAAATYGWEKAASDYRSMLEEAIS
jgi:glycosyltransferase involved in cell wall biosynthesis